MTVGNFKWKHFVPNLHSIFVTQVKTHLELMFF